MSIKPRERSAILQSLSAGVVPRVGLHHIQVGRKKELEALLADLARVEEGGAAVRFVIGRFGSGKSFFLNLVRTVALERKLVVLHADITIDRRLHGNGAAVAMYTELLNSMATRAKPEGGALSGLIERFVTDVHGEASGKPAGSLDAAVRNRLQPLLDMTHGSSFVRVLGKYVEGFASHNDTLTNSAMRWLRGEYKTKTEARTDLDVRDIIDDQNLYDMLKLWGRFVRLAGYRGLLVNVDEMVVLSERLNNGPARTKNYEIILQIVNDCLQGGVEGLSFCFAGTEEFLSDTRRGLFSYEALATRLADNPFAKKDTIDLNSPVVRLLPLTREDLYVLLERIALVQAGGDAAKVLVNQDGMIRFMSFCERRLGAEHFLTPRDTVKQFTGLLNVLAQNPGQSLDTLLSGQISEQPPENAKAQGAPASREGEQLAKFTL